MRAARPYFYVSDFKDVRVKLVAEATADGYRRAVPLASTSKGKVGAVISTQQGVSKLPSVTPPRLLELGVRYFHHRKEGQGCMTLEYAIEPSRVAERE